MVASGDEGSHTCGHVGVEFGEGVVYLGGAVQNDAFCPGFVGIGLGQGSLEHVGEWTVTDVVEEGRCEGVAGQRRGNSVFGGKGAVQIAKAMQQTFHDVGGADGVCEPRVFGAWIRKRCEPELSDPTQPLHFPSFQECFDNLLLG